jgi:V/A-type H+-transporting ATPase subunit D
VTDRELIPTQSAYLELKAERAGMDEGYRFLDEKRLILASEILSALRAHEQTMKRWREAERAALHALRGAVGRHGLEELSLYPPLAAPSCAAEPEARTVLGVRIEQLPSALDPLAVPPAIKEGGEPAPESGIGIEHGSVSADGISLPGLDANPSSETEPPRRALNPSPEAEHCRDCFAELLPIARQLAVIDGNLERLRDEYTRTARRARALEDVLLPEIDDNLKAIDNALEELEREESVRVRYTAR